MHVQPTAGPSGSASHNLTGRVSRTSDDLLSAAGPDFGQALAARMATERARLEAEGLARPTSDWASEPLCRLRTVWALLSPSQIVVGLGLDHGDVLAGAGLRDLQPGWTVATLQATGEPEALRHMVEALQQVFRPQVGPRMTGELRRLVRLCESRWRAWASAQAALYPDSDEAAELADLASLEDDTEELDLAGVRQ